MEQPALCEQEKDCFGGWPMKPELPNTFKDNYKA